jgi:hypothetical protein
VYGRQLDGQTLEFGHEGILYRNSFIMYDRGTKSLWVHTTGQCVKGKLKGKQLEFIPSTVTSWGVWSARHPLTVVLEGRKARGMMGAFSLTKKTADSYGISVGQGDDVKLYPVPALLTERVVLDRFHGRDIAVFFDAEGLHATAWERGEREFKWNGKSFVDKRGRAWNASLGRPVDATDESEQLIPLPATTWLTRRWKGFYPKSEIFSVPDAE